MAAARDISLVTVAFSGVLPERARSEVFDDLRLLWQAEGLDEPSWADVYGDLYLRPSPTRSVSGLTLRSCARSVLSVARRAHSRPHGWRRSASNDPACT